jgi:glycosyltransferase involved in cell wall biosynthesis
VISQTYPNVEYIIIDGGSTDGTLDIIKKYEDYIDYWVSEADKGIYDAMNKGVDLATGQWINFMNTGDRFYDENSIEEVFSKDLKKKMFLFTATQL